MWIMISSEIPRTARISRISAGLTVPGRTTADAPRSRRKATSATVCAPQPIEAVRPRSGNRRCSADRVPTSLTMISSISRSRRAGMLSKSRARSCGFGMVLSATWSFRPAEATSRCAAASSSQPNSLRAPPRLQPFRPTYTASAPASSAARTASGLPPGASRTGARITPRRRDPPPREIRKLPPWRILHAVDYSSRRVILGTVSIPESRGFSVLAPDLPIMAGDGRAPEPFGDLPHDGPPPAFFRVCPEDDHVRADEGRPHSRATVRPPDARGQPLESAPDHRRSGAPDLRDDEHDLRPGPENGARRARPYHALLERSPPRARQPDPVGRAPPSPLHGGGRGGPPGRGRRAGARPVANRVRDVVQQLGRRHQGAPLRKPRGPRSRR